MSHKVNNIKLSIITINLNNKEGLIKTIQSVVSQTRKDFEFIVIDGGSIDGSKEIIEKSSEEINYWISEPDRGIYNAMNKGILKSSGDYLLFLNSGDYLYDNETLSYFFNEIQENRYDVIYGNSNYLYDNSNEVVKYKSENEITFNLFSKLGAINHQASITRRSCIEKVGYFDENLKIVSDWKLFMIGIFKYNFRIKHIDVILVNYDANGISSIRRDILDKEAKQVLEEEFYYFLKDYDELHNLRVIQHSLMKSRLIKIFRKLGYLKVFDLMYKSLK
jgi:glycosyltransferase involved in cell wall biosynthesis